MFKLKNISEEQKSNFQVQGLGTCRFFYELIFNNNTEYYLLKDYIQNTGKQVTDKERQFISNKNYLFACFDNKKLYKIDEIGTLYLFDIKLYEKNRDSKIETLKVETNPIPPEVVIATKNIIIVNIMKLRGCKILPNGSEYFITPSPQLPPKKFLDNLIIKEEKFSNSIKTKTGIEKDIQLIIQDTETKKQYSCKGIFVSNIKENAAYVCFDFNGFSCFYDVWYGDKGEILDNWQITKNKESLKGKSQSKRIYTWYSIWNNTKKRK